MKKLFFVILFACSFTAQALSIEEWNRQFSELNNVPLNQKWGPTGQHAYLRQLIASKPGHYKNPDDYRLVNPVPEVPSVPPPPTVVSGDKVKELLQRIKADIRALELQLQ